MLVDAGADVVKVEPDGGDPLRRWRSGGLFEYLNEGKRSITGDEARARRMVGSYLRTGADAPEFASFVAFTQPSTYAQVLPGPAGSATTGAATTIHDAPAVAVRDAAGSTLYVARTGRAYPLRLDGLANGQVVFLDLTGYGDPVTLTPPGSRSVLDPGSGS